MSENNFKTLLNGTRNDLKIIIDDFFNVIDIMHEDIEMIKVKISKPDKHSAALLLDYLGWEEGKSKQNLEKLCGEEIKEYLSWLDYYCKKEGTIREQLLKAVINEEI